MSAGSGRAAVIAVHPEATDDPRTIRWVVPAGTFTFVGTPRAVPAGLQALLDDGSLTAIVVEPASLLTILAIAIVGAPAAPIGDWTMSMATAI